MTVMVALLRGVNVGGKTTLPMADLRRVATDLGYDDVATYIQSGNLVLPHVGLGDQGRQGSGGRRSPRSAG